MRSILDQYKGQPVFGLLGVRRPEAYKLTVKGVAKPVFILGSYHTHSGGCDQIQPYDLILDLIRKYVERGHVLFEGVIVSSSYGRVGRLMEEYGQEAVMLFLATSLEDCLKNVQKRRTERGDDRTYNPANTISKFNQIAGSKGQMLKDAKLRVVDATSDKAKVVIEALLRKAN